MNPPERLFLQWYDDEGGEQDIEFITWCRDLINPGLDVEYIREDIVYQLIRDAEDIENRLDDFIADYKRRFP